MIPIFKTDCQTGFHARSFQLDIQPLCLPKPTSLLVIRNLRHSLGVWKVARGASVPGRTSTASTAGAPKSSWGPSTLQDSWKGRSLQSLKGDHSVSASSPGACKTSAYNTPGVGVAASSGPLLGLLPSNPAACSLFICKSHMQV